jgi:DNA polymerase III alpha subunit (gram-positive type)
MMSEIYVSIDIEADGFCAFEYSMLSLGAVAYSSELVEIGEFIANFELLPDAGQCKETMDWWLTQPEAWKICRQNQERPIDAMQRFSKWLHDLPGQPVAVAWPSGFDYSFVHDYLIRFCDYDPFRHSCIDIKTLAMGVLKKPYKKITKKILYRRFPPKTKHTHCALDDAREQGEVFCGIMKELNIYETKEDK